MRDDDVSLFLDVELVLSVIAVRPRLLRRCVRACIYAKDAAIVELELVRSFIQEDDAVLLCAVHRSLSLSVGTKLAVDQFLRERFPVDAIGFVDLDLERMRVQCEAVVASDDEFEWRPESRERLERVAKLCELRVLSEVRSPQ